jgi:hypothetical protein
MLVSLLGAPSTIDIQFGSSPDLKGHHKCVATVPLIRNPSNAEGANLDAKGAYLGVKGVYLGVKGAHLALKETRSDLRQCKFVIMECDVRYLRKQH